MEATNNTAAEAEAMAVLNDLADKRTIKAAKAAVAAKAAGWQYDPAVNGVVGLISRDGRTAGIIVYTTAGDFEVGDTFAGEYNL